MTISQLLSGFSDECVLVEENALADVMHSMFDKYQINSPYMYFG